jgi:GNAT superfamily N-acetyltransferase
VIRSATTSDYPVFVELFRELGVDEAPPSLDRWRSDLMRSTLLSERETGVDGYINYYTLSETGYVRNLVVASRARNAGVGAKLMRAAASVLRASGVNDWHLNVKADNAPAIHLYESLGLAVEHRSTVVRLPWALVDQLPAEPATVLPVAPDEPEEDAEIERALGLLAGRIAMSRLRHDRVVRQLRDDTLAPVGFAAFDADFPGANPFRVARPSLAASLLAALRPYARHDYVQVIAENDDALTELLVATGAEIRLRLLHLRGPLPA